MSVTWEPLALRRSGLTERQAEAMLALSSAAEHAVTYPSKQAVRAAWDRQGEDEPVTLTSPQILYTSTEIERYAEMAKSLGY